MKATFKIVYLLPFLLLGLQHCSKSRLVRQLIIIPIVAGAGGGTAYAIHEYNADAEPGTVDTRSSITYINPEAGLSKDDFENIDEVRTVDVSQLAIEPKDVQDFNERFLEKSTALIIGAHKDDPSSVNNPTPFQPVVYTTQHPQAKAVLYKVLPKDLHYTVGVEPQSWPSMLWDFAQENYWLTFIVLFWTVVAIRKLLEFFSS